MQTKRLLFLSALLLLIPLFVGCTGTEKYTAEPFFGKTSAEIVAEYGAFDCTVMPPNADGLYRSSSCGYTIKEPRVGFLGTSPEVLFFIRFDENGVAVECSEGYRPGG